MISGWIKLHRKIKNSWIFKDPVYLKAWVTILLEVNHTSGKTLVGGSLIAYNPGESLKSLDTWGLLFGGWSKCRVLRFFHLLKSDNMIDTKSETKTTRLSVCNWADYQNERNDNDTDDDTDNDTEHETQAIHRQECIKNEKNEKNENKEEKEYCPNSPEFRLAVIFWNDIKSEGTAQKEPDLQQWAVGFDKIHRIDKRPYDWIKITMLVARKDHFWKSNLRSPEKLRTHINSGKLDIFSPKEFETDEIVVAELAKKEETNG